MPSYVFTTALDLGPEVRAKIVESVTSIHNVEATAPRYFVQVIFNKVEPGSIYIGGEPASLDHIWVRADIRSGRTNEQKSRMLERIMRDTGNILKVSQEAIWVYICDVPADNIAEFGAILPQPGGEKAWLASLPEGLRKKLDNF
jgi:phenylpyruvate tautomerase PptA (4-oxalocrotonate tautomerase family)